MRTVTFCGHSRLDDSEKVRVWLNAAVEQAVAQGAEEFLLGGYGEFDRMALSAVRRAQEGAPHIRAVLVLPYLNRDLGQTDYDASVYPPLENTPPRLAILRRNRWMVDHCDLLICCVTRNWGGAAATLAYALHRRKEVIRYPS